MRGEGQRLSAHLKAAFAEIERLKVVYRHAIEKLEMYTLPNLSPQSAAQWFEMYLRVVDLGVQIRRGEIRHRTTQKFTYPCMHKTGTKGAVHSGLSIDDGNAIFQLMEQRKLVKESRLDGWFMKMDALDRDDVGLLDKRITGCLEDFRRRSSVFYNRLEITGEDPHEEMLVLGVPGNAAHIMSKVTRTCFGPKNCSCKEDAKPWEDFCLKSGDPHAHNRSSTGGGDGAGVDVGIMDIKRQMGFEELSGEEKNEDTAALARDAAELAPRRKPQGDNIITSGLRAAPSARSIYQKKCEENGLKPKPHMNALMAVKKGSHHLILSGIGFHTADDLQDLVDIFSTPGLPPVTVLDVSKGFFTASTFQMLCQLLRVPLLRQSIEQLNLRGIAVPERADFATLMGILTSVNSSSIEPLPAFSKLKILDLSFNTLWHEGAAQLQGLLASLPSLKNLSLESCFPEPVSSFDQSSSSSNQNATSDSVRGALVEASNRLERLNFGSNCVAFESQWLDALFTPDSTLQEIDLRGVNSFSITVGDTTETMEVDWQGGDTWDLQQIETLKWSSSSSVYSEKLLGALSAELQGGFAQLKHLDLEINITAGQDQADRKAADTIQSIADYAVLKSCRICCYNRNGAISHGMSASIARLLEDGLRECEVLTLRVPQMRLDPRAICDLLSCTVVSKMRKMTLAVSFACGDQVQPNFGSCFQQMRSVQEHTLELHVDEQSDASEAAASALARELESSWLGSAGNFKRDEKRGFDRATGDRSFVLSKQQKSRKRIYRCCFLATPTP